jgi:hypothetical protein
MSDQVTAEDDETGIDVDDIQFECLDDPVLVHHTRQLYRYENAVLLVNYDIMCTRCVGDKRVIGHEHLKSSKDALCPECKGTSRIPKAAPSE